MLEFATQHPWPFTVCFVAAMGLGIVIFLRMP
jgi:hypothetical protein